jgi:NAD(P)-dependent dehydrogenase (short-subunit alcohol dehydrogenase family)
MGNLTFDGRVAVVSGAGGGMGREHALLLAKRGAKVVVNDVGITYDGVSWQGDSPVTPAVRVMQEIKDAGGEAIANQDDISSEVGVANLMHQTIEAYGRVDIVVHNAGFGTFVPISELSYDEYRRVVAVNADGAFLLARAAWPHMVRQKYGRFVVITSQAALLGFAGLGSYAVGKWGETGLCRTFALEGAPHNIKANALGVTALTGPMDKLFPTEGDAGELTGFRGEAHQWWRDHATPAIISPAVAFLAHEDCPVSGEIFDTSAGHISHQKLVMTNGYSDPHLTPESLRDNFDQVLDETQGLFHFPHSLVSIQWMHKKIGAKLGCEPPPLS